MIFHRGSRFGRQRAFTLVELLVVIAIIAMLVTLLLPAVQSAREAARNTQCKNKIRQMAVAVHSHLGAFQHFPGDGWGYWWVGDPDRGAGKRQPGGWLYRILPFTEASDVYNLGKDGQPQAITQPQLAGLSQALQTHLPWFNCPTRRDARLSQLATSPWNYRNVAVTDRAATISYFANWGDTLVDYEPGPGSLQAERKPAPQANGVVFWDSAVGVQQVADGLSKTYLVGDMYWSRNPDGDSSFVENYFGIGTPLAHGYVATGAMTPKQDRRQEVVEIGRWGSSHPSSWNIAFCDGSVRGSSFEIDPEAHRRLANRKDGQGLTDY